MLAYVSWKHNSFDGAFLVVVSWETEAEDLPQYFRGIEGDERVIREVASLWRWLQRCDPTLTAGNAYLMPLQPDYRILDLVSGKYC
jgi:hypothetical protein